MAAAPDNARQARPRPARRGVLGRGARGGAAAVGKAVGEAVECSAKHVKRDPSSQCVDR